MGIEVNNESGVDVDEVVLAELSRHVLDSLRVNPLAELSVVLLDVAAMASLHKQWMDLDGPTDVMAFPMDMVDFPLGPGGTDPPGPRDTAESVGPPLLGDVVLCPEVAAAQAGNAGHPVESELSLLCTHGILHLLGYDHGDPDEEREMFELQARILAEWAEAAGRPPARAPRPGTSAQVRDTARAPGGERRG